MRALVSGLAGIAAMVSCGTAGTTGTAGVVAPEQVEQPGVVDCLSGMDANRAAIIRFLDSRPHYFLVPPPNVNPDGTLAPQQPPETAQAFTELAYQTILANMANSAPFMAFSCFNDPSISSRFSQAAFDIMQQMQVIIPSTPPVPAPPDEYLIPADGDIKTVVESATATRPYGGGRFQQLPTQLCHQI